LKIARKILRVAAWIFTIVLGIVLLAYILIQVPAVQDYARGKIVVYLQNKLKTDVQIGRLSIAFPKKIVLENVYFADQKGDTLLSGKKISVDISLLKLINNRVEIKYVALDGIRANIYRNYPDTLFNFSYIINAFAPPAANSTKDTAGAMYFKVDRLALNNINANYHDDKAGSDMMMHIGSLHADIDQMDINRSFYSIPAVELANTIVHIRQYQSLFRDADTAQNVTPAFDIRFKDIGINDVQFGYVNSISDINTQFNIGQLTAKARSVNLDSLNIQLESLNLDNTTAAIRFGKSKQAAVTVKELGNKIKEVAASPWNIQVARLSINNNNIAYDDDNQPRQPYGMDYAHMHFQDLSIGADSVVLSPQTIHGMISNAAFTERKSGTVLKQLQADFVFDDQHTAVKNLFLQTDRTALRRNVLLTYSSTASMATQPGDIYLEADIDQSILAVRDILAFAPALKQVPPFKGNEGEVFNIDGNVKGYIKQLFFQHVAVSGFRNTSVDVSGSITGLPSANAHYNVAIASLHTTRQDLFAFLPKGSIPPTVQLPQVINASGKFKGTVTRYNTSLQANTDKGSMALTLSMNGDSYQGKVQGTGLDIGYITKQANVGTATFLASISGNGFNYQSSPIDVDAYVSAIQVNNYNYHNIQFKGNLRNGILQGAGDMNDTNADLDFVIQLNLAQTNPSLNVQLSVDSLNLEALGYSKMPFKIHGNIHLNMPSLNTAALEGNATISDIVFVKDGKRITLDSVNIVASPNAIALRSAVAVADLKGTYNLVEIAQALQNIMDQYYHIEGYQPIVLTTVQDWTLNATVFPSETLYAFMPELKGTDTIQLSAKLNTAQNDFQFAAGTRKMRYGIQAIDSLAITGATAGQQFNYAVTARAAGSKSFSVDRTVLDGSISNDVLAVQLDVKDRQQKSRYRLSGALSVIPGGYRFNLAPDSLMFDYENWAVGNGNFIESTNQGILVNNFTISRGNQLLSANSTSGVPNSPIDLTFSDFEISTITHIADQEQLLMGGTINGGAVLSNFNTDPVFTSDLTINHFSYKGDTLGNIVAKVNNRSANTLFADVTLTGGRNDVHLNGIYQVNTQSLDMQLDMRKFNLSSVKPFLSEQLRDIGGVITGNMSVNGKITAPQLDGSIRFDSAFVAPALLGERFTLPNQELKVTSEGIRLDHFVIKDSLGGQAVINGSIVTTDFANFEYDFYLTADNFRILNTRKHPNAPYYGNLNIDVDLAVYGDMKSPTLEGNLRVNRETNLSVLLPGDNPEIVSREGVVHFVDADNPADSIFLSKYNVLDTIVSQMKVSGLDLAATIETDTAAQFNLIVNDLTGDVLAMRGRADLAAGIDRSGKISLTGNFELNSGYYELSFEFIRRRFDIQRGSMVTWTGDPTQAIIDVTANYVASTSPINLVAPQLETTTTELNRFKQRLPFNVKLYLKGQILSPVISFNIILPENYAAAWKEVDEKLVQVRRDQAELTKQVFALLLLGRFVQENPFQDAGAGVTVSRLARESVSRLITEQLNQWANALLPGLGLNFGVVSMEDYTTGELRNRTDLTVSVTRQMFNDRIRVTVGSNFELEGPANRNNPGEPATGFASDVAIDYLVNKDGRYILRAYRKNAYEVLVDGQAVETGLRFILTMDYNRFRELFQRRKKDEMVAPVRKRTTTNTSEDVPKPVEDNKQ